MSKIAEGFECVWCGAPVIVDQVPVYGDQIDPVGYSTVYHCTVDPSHTDARPKLE